MPLIGQTFDWPDFTLLVYVSHRRSSDTKLTKASHPLSYLRNRRTSVYITCLLTNGSYVCRATNCNL